jgi:hypothetical protein
MSDGNKDARFRFCTKRRELRMFHTRRGYSSNLSAGIAQSREILKVNSNPVTAVFDWSALEITQGW